MTTRRAAIWGLAVIFTANFFNYMDRSLVSAMERHLRPAFGLSSAEFGFLWTLFTLGYMVCAPPIGGLADRRHRPRLFAVCIVIWSLATVACGWTDSKSVLYAARVLIGVGEAGCLIIGPALISDLFPQQARGKALSVFYLGLPLGGTAAFLLSSAAGTLGWRNLFYLAGVPGFLIAALIWYLPDPPRGGESGGHKKPTLRDYVALLRNRTLLLIILAQTFAVIVLIPLMHFGKEFFIEARHMSEEQASLALGILVLAAGALGNVLSGVIGDRLAKRGVKGAYALLAGVAFLAGWPCILIGFKVLTPWVYLPALGVGCFCYFLCMPAVNTQIANVVSPMQRAAAWALAVFVLHLLGDTVAPPVFGKISETVSRENTFAWFSCSLILAGVCCLLASRTAADDQARAAEKVG